MARIEGGDLVALEAKYHLECLTALRNRQRSFKLQLGKESGECLKENQGLWLNCFLISKIALMKGYFVLNFRSYTNCMSSALKPWHGKGDQYNSLKEENS